MAAKQLIFDEQARQAILRGVSKLTKAVVASSDRRAATSSLTKNPAPQR